MSGHSKWATIKHKKGALDAKRGKIFTRLIKEITIAAKTGGGDPDGNPRLRGAIAAAKAENMPADNNKRAVSEIRHAFSKNGGNLGESNSVSWMFTKKGVITVAKSTASEDKLTEIVLDAGAEDLSDEGENWEVLCDPKDFEAVTEALKAAKITPEHAEVTKIASTYTKLEGTQARAMVRLLETIEALDDTQNVYSNFDFDEASMSAAGH